MTVTVDATIGGAAANSYLTVADADAIAEYRLGTLAWSTATTDDKGRALIQATAYLDQLGYIGSKATTTQALLWPRDYAECGDWSFTNAVIPGPVKTATFDLANELLTTPTLLTGGNASLNELIPGIPNADLKSASIDVLSVEFRGGGAPIVRDCLTALPSLVGILGCLTTSSPQSGSGTIRAVRS
ncbi:MAG: hypothetical protein EBR86_15000 [Planctomycetia bacterium]|nr:hypothetical protein [Planctomycetia bacterium]